VPGQFFYQKHVFRSPRGLRVVDFWHAQVANETDQRYPPHHRLGNHSIESLEGPLYTLVDRCTSVVKLDARFVLPISSNAWPQFFEPVIHGAFRRKQAFFSLSATFR
jgi:hypothetical protein